FWFGYTQRSFWQVYNQDESAPFRETDYEPELFFRHQLGWDMGPGTLSAVSIGFNHQSNGQADARSRSWNRIMGSVGYSYDRWLFMVKPWLRLPESGGDDDNADIERYLGHASYHAVYKLTEDRTFSLKLLNNLRSDNRTSVEFGYSFPMGDTLKGFFQYYNGYGESLIDYNHRIARFGIGIMLNDWLQASHSIYLQTGARPVWGEVLLKHAPSAPPWGASAPPSMAPQSFRRTSPQPD